MESKQENVQPVFRDLWGFPYELLGKHAIYEHWYFYLMANVFWEHHFPCPSDILKIPFLMRGLIFTYIFSSY